MPHGFTYGTLCSGIEGFGAGLDAAGGSCEWQVEINPLCRLVLSKHWTDAVRHSDMLEVGGHNLDTVDVLAGGPPCQSFSVAGLRKGLADERGNLTLEFVRICDELDPAIILFENVPGILSDKTNAFGCLLAALVGADAPLVVPADIGGRWADAGVAHGTRRTVAWRILDAQFFGTPQRRRRVFLVASADPECACEILFESKSLRGDTAPSGETGEDFAAAFGNSPDGSGEGLFGDATDARGGDKGVSILTGSEEPVQLNCGEVHEVCYDMTHADDVIREVVGGITPTLQARMGTGGNQRHLVATSPHNAAAESVIAVYDPSPAVTAKWAKGSGGPAGDECQNEVLARPYLAEVDFAEVECFETRVARNGRGAPNSVVPALRASAVQGDAAPCITAPGMAIRRLTPTECERLQGFNDEHTAFGVAEPPSGEMTPEEVDLWNRAHVVPMSDSTRYKMVGNAVNCAVSTWLAKRVYASFCRMKGITQ